MSPSLRLPPGEERAPHIAPPAAGHLDLRALIVQCAEEVGHQTLLVVHPLRQVEHPGGQHTQELKAYLKGQRLKVGGWRLEVGGCQRVKIGLEAESCQSKPAESEEKGSP